MYDLRIMVDVQSIETRKAKAFELFQTGKLSQALHQCKVMCDLGQADASVWCLRAVIEGQTKAPIAAARSAKRAVELEPNNPDCQFNLGLALLFSNHAKEALVHLKRTAEINPAHPNIQQFIAQAYEGSGNLPLAHQHYDRAIAENPDDVDRLAYIGRRYELMQETEKCRTIISHALLLNPLHPESNLLMARLDRYAGNLGSARDRLNKVLSIKLSHTDIANLSNELGHILDRLGDYAGAFEAFKKKVLGVQVSGQRRFDPTVLHRHIRHVQSKVTLEAAAQWKQTLPNDDLPAPIFLVAFPRSGTTLLERILSTCPDIVISNEEGMIEQTIDSISMITTQSNNYPENLNALTSDDITALRRNYWELASNITGYQPQEKLLLDKLPLNLVNLAFIHRLFPNASIILALRDPRDCCLSCFMQIFLQSTLTASFNSIDETAELYAASMDILQHYRRTLDLRLFESRYEDLVNEPEKQIHALVDFLKLEWRDDFLNHHKKKHYKTQRTPSGLDVSRPIYKRATGRWTHYAPYMKSSLEKLQPYVEAFGYAE